MQTQTSTQSPKAANELKRDRLLTMEEVASKVSLGKSTLYAKIGQGLFPSGIRVGPRAIRWSEQSIDLWIDGQRTPARQGVEGEA